MGFIRFVGLLIVATARKSWNGAVWVVTTAHTTWKTRQMARQLLGVANTAAARSGRCTVFFSPRGGCTAAVIAAIDKAKQSVLVQAYGFTAVPIAQALIAAHRRGVKVRLVLDSDGKASKYNQGATCAAAGIDVAWDAKHLIQHSKVMILDNQLVITGSFNFTQSAETGNAENLLLINDPKLAAVYAANWDLHRGHSVA